MSQQRKELYSLLIPLQEERLLVPRVCVAEVIGYSEPERTSGNGELPSWYLGAVEWNGRRLPVVFFESMSGEAELPSQRGRARIVVFHALSEDLSGGYYGILTQGFPQLVRVNPDVISLDPQKGWPENQPVVCRVRMINEYPLIPDVELLERMIADLPVVQDS